PFGRSDAFTRGGFAIMPHATAPLSLMLEGVSLNYVWLNKKISTTSLTCCFKHRPSIGSFNVTALTSKVAQ
ncbi:hypothetical protein Q4523_19930, partial [Alteromonas stellipolaris]|nr:hypothetical protein [Alteromonas stellipolaris]